MSKRILKYWHPATTGRAIYHIPVGARVLHAGVQTNESWDDPNSICLWAEVLEDAPRIQVRARFVDTGEPAPSDLWDYCDTVQYDGLVRHVYLLTEDLDRLGSDRTDEEAVWPE